MKRSLGWAVAAAAMLLATLAIQSLRANGSDVVEPTHTTPAATQSSAEMDIAAGRIEVADARHAPFVRATPSATQPDKQVALGHIDGRVAAANGGAPEQVTISAVSLDGQPRRSTVAQSGDFEFDLPPGTWRFEVGDLPPGYVPPAMQEAVLPKGAPNTPWPEGYYATTTCIPPLGGTFAVDLRIFQTAAAQGRVVGPHREGIPGVFVRLQAASKFTPGVACDATTDGEGFFHITDARPGRYVVQMWLDGAPSQYRELSLPIAPAIDIFEGTNSVGELRLGGGTRTLLGRVIDEDGMPIMDRPIRVVLDSPPEPGDGPHSGSTLASTTTRADGSFAITNLPAVPVLVIISEMTEAPNPEGKGRVIVRKEATHVDLSRGLGPFDLGDLSIERSHPFYLKGRITIDQSFLAAREIKPDFLRVLIRPADPEGPDIPGRPKFDSAQVSVQKDGTFTWWCETPHVPVLLDIQCMGCQIPPFNALNVVVVPLASTRQELDLTWPQELNTPADER